jgi:hypothetical protein
MSELIRAFGEIDKAADTLFGDLKSHWYTFGIGSAGASHALSQFKTQYESLLAQGKDKEASDLLRGTRESAEHVLALQKQATAGNAAGGTGSDEAWASEVSYMNAATELKKAGVGFTEKEVEAQQALVDALNDQAGVEERVASLKKADSGNASKSVGNEMAGQRAAAARAAAEHTSKMGELGLAAQREQATIGQSLRQASIAERLASDIALADKEYAIQQQTNQNLIAALDKGGKDYNNQLAALHNKAAEETAQHANNLASLTGKASLEQYHKDLQDIEESEREKIDATDQGSAERLAAIDAAIKDEASRNLQATQHYRELLTERVQVAKQSAAEESKARADAAKQSADNDLNMGELALAASREKQALQDSARRISVQMRMSEEIKAANDEHALKLTAMSQVIAALDKGGKDYENKLRELQNKQKQLIRAHENEVTGIKDKAEMERNQRVLSAEQRFNDTIAAGLAQAAMGHKSFAAVMSSIGNQIATGMIENAIKSILANDMTKESDAAAAARKAYLAGMHFPFPVNIVMGPTLGAMAFASVMAFQEGGIVPGIGTGDTVPAMLEPGEGVIPREVMEGRGARSGNTGGGSTHIVHVRPVYHLQSLDSEGMSRVLEKHSDQLQKHFTNTVRKMNR